MCFHYKPTPEYQRPLQCTVPRLNSKPVPWQAPEEAQASTGGWHEQTFQSTRLEVNWSDFVLWAESWHLYELSFGQWDAKDSLNQHWTLKHCANSLLPFQLDCEEGQELTNAESFWSVKMIRSYLHEHLMGTVTLAIDLVSDLGWGKPCSSSERLGNFSPLYSVSSTSPSPYY